MLRKITLLIALAFAAFTSCTDIDRNVDVAPAPLEAVAKGDLPMAATQTSVLFTNTKNGTSRLVILTATPLVFPDCGSDWCSVGEREAEEASSALYTSCMGENGPILVIVPETISAGGSFHYDNSSKKILFDGVNFDENLAVWGRPGVEYDVVQQEFEMTFSCADCPGMYEGFEYTDRSVSLKAFR